LFGGVWVCEGDSGEVRKLARNDMCAHARRFVVLGRMLHGAHGRVLGFVDADDADDGAS